MIPKWSLKLISVGLVSVSVCSDKDGVLPQPGAALVLPLALLRFGDAIYWIKSRNRLIKKGKWESSNKKSRLRFGDAIYWIKS